MKPEWLKIKYADNDEIRAVEALLTQLNLNTVCSQALCPNYMECFGRRTATFMILGVHCTRNCRFCNVTYAPPEPVDADEPRRIGEAVRQLELKYVVVTSVTRDDLADGGAYHFAEVVRAIRAASPETAIEVLIPDLQGDVGALECVKAAKPDIISHNVETVPRIYAQVRPQADYRRSLHVIKKIGAGVEAAHSKSGMMLGLGETWDEVIRVFNDLREAGCEFLSVGQYLAPSKQHHPVIEYIHPDVFDRYAEAARELGFAYVASAPLVRSSYRADGALAGGE